jgi:uncharacterized protein
VRRVVPVVIDTNVLTGAMLGRAGHNRSVIRACLEGRVRPLIGQALFLEYEDVLGRSHLYRGSPLSRKEREELFAAFSERLQVGGNILLLAAESAR